MEYRRRLPHFRPDGAYLFVTWRLYRSLPQRQPITQWIKGRTARECNLLLERSGLPFWEQESYDHWVRDEKQFNRIVEYIERNPISAGFAASAEDWPWSSANAS